MKTKKRILALTLVLLMVLALSACGKKNELLGTWTTEVDMASIMVNEVDDNVDLDDQGIEIASYGDYLGTLPLRITMELHEDGTYVQRVEESSVEDMKTKVFNATVGYYRDIFRQAIAASLKENGIDADVSTDAGLEEVLGMSIDDAISMALGSDMESFVHSVLDGMWDELANELTEEGKYKAEDGKLFLSAGKEYNVDPKVYHPYTLKDGVLTLEKLVGGDEDDATNFLYPLTLRLVK